jgi:acetylornithine/N-succinyldiaminopimelate aminotransferase
MENKHSYVVPMGKINKESAFQIEVDKADGSSLYDINGKKYLDLRSGLWNVSLGYNKELYKIMQEKVEEQFKNALPFLDINSYNNKYYSEYSTKLLEFINNGSEVYSKVFYTNSGSEGTELAVKLTRHLKSSKNLITYDKSYHGTFYAGMSASGIDQEITKDYFPKVEGFITIKTPATEAEEINVIKFIENNHQTIAAILFEPVLGSGGVFLFRKEFLQTLDSTLKKHNILLIFDEVATGFFRTGSRFHFMGIEVYPDIIILSKSINNGTLPFGAVIIKREAAEKLEQKQVHIEHFSTQNGNLLGVISALCTLDYFIENEKSIVSNVTHIDRLTRDTLNRNNIQFEGIGGMFSIPINDGGETIRLVDTFQELGFLTYYYYVNDEDNGLTLFPPLLIDLAQYEKALRVISRRVRN